MKTLLYVSTRSPYPLLGGEKNKTFNTIKILSERYKVIYCGQARIEEQSEVKKLLEPFCSEIVLFEPKIIFKVLGLIQSFFMLRPLQIGFFFNPIQRHIILNLSKKVDFVFLNIIRSVQFVESGINVPIYLDMYDSISEHYKNAVHVTTSPFWKFIYFIESKLMRRYEDRFLPMFKKVFMFNPAEIEIYGLRNLCWVPHGVNDSVINYKYEGELKKNKRVSFLGKMDYRPNIEAVKWFAKHVVPLLPNEYEFQVIGANPTAEVLDLAKNDSRIIVTGYVDDPFRMLLESHVVVCPMVSGGGIQNKLLESMGLGCLNLVSPLASKPFRKRHGSFVVCGSPEEFRSAILSAAFFAKYAENAKSMIKHEFSWGYYSKILFENLV